MRSKGCSLQSRLQERPQSPSSPLLHGVAIRKSLMPAQWQSCWQVPRGTSGAHIFMAAPLPTLAGSHRPSATPSTFVLTAWIRGDNQDTCLQDPDCCKVRQVCRHLAPTGYRPATRVNLHACSKISRWFWIQELYCECHFHIHQIIALPYKVFFLKALRFLTCAWLTKKNLGINPCGYSMTPFPFSQLFIKCVHSFEFAFP